MFNLYILLLLYYLYIFLLIYHDLIILFLRVIYFWLLLLGLLLLSAVLRLEFWAVRSSPLPIGSESPAPVFLVPGSPGSCARPAEQPSGGVQFARFPSSVQRPAEPSRLFFAVWIVGESGHVPDLARFVALERLSGFRR